MAAETQPPKDDAALAPELALTDVAKVLQQYHHQQLVMHMVGPAVSLVVHVIVLTAISVMAVSSARKEEVKYEIKIEEVKIKEIEPEVEKEMQEVKELQTTETTTTSVQAPEISVPDAPAETVAEAGPAGGGGLDDGPPTGGVGGLGGGGFDDIASVVDVRLGTSSIKLPGYYAGRSASGRATSVKKYGGTPGGQKAVERAMGYLVKKQNENGSWGSNSPAHTGLALLVFLAHGETPLSEKYGSTVQKGMQWLANEMVAKKNLGQNAYGHGIATYALAEAYGMTKIPFLRNAMETGIDTIIKGQGGHGGFFYSYGKAGQWDLSVSGWQFQALKSAYVAGATNPGLKEAITKCVKFLKNDAFKNARFGYQSAGTGGNMTGVGTVGLQLLGEGDCREAREALATISTERLAAYKAVHDAPKTWEEKADGFIYGWYYDTQAMFNKGGKMWRAWQNEFEPTLNATQNSDGSWSTGKQGHTADPILCTTWCALQLEVYYRYLPTFDIGKMDQYRTTTTGGTSGGLGLEGGDTGLIIE